jgi:hypothetical protein
MASGLQNEADVNSPRLQVRPPTTPQATLFLKPTFSITVSGASLSVAVRAEPAQKRPADQVVPSAIRRPGA